METPIRMKFFTVLMILLLTSFGCDSSETESSSGESSTDTSSKANQIKKDTVSLKPEQPKFDLSPAQAKVEGQVIDIRRLPKKATANLILKVSNILGRAKTTPAIAKKDTLVIRIQNSSDFEIGNMITATIQYNLSTKATASLPAWSMIKREK